MANDKKVPDPQEDGGLDALLDSLGAAGGFYVKVYRLTGSKVEYCGRLEAADLENPEEQVRDLYGGGRFQLRFFRVGQLKPGEKRYLHSLTMDITGPTFDLSRGAAPESTREREDRRAEEIEEREARIQELRFEERMMEFRREVRETLAELRSPPAAAAMANPASMTLEIVKTVQAMVEPYLARMPASPTRDVDPIELVKLGVKLARSAREEGGGRAGSYDTVVERLGLPLLELLQRQAGAGHPGHALATTSNPPDEPMPPRNALELMGPWVPYLQEWAAQGRNAGLRAAFILDSLTPGTVELLAQYLEGPTALDDFLTRYPDTQPYRRWYEGLFRGLVAELFEEEDADGEDVPEAEVVEEEEGE